MYEVAYVGGVSPLTPESSRRRAAQARLRYWRQQVRFAQWFSLFAAAPRQQWVETSAATRQRLQTCRLQYRPAVRSAYALWEDEIPRLNDLGSSHH